MKVLAATALLVAALSGCARDSGDEQTAAPPPAPAADSPATMPSSPPSASDSPAAVAPSPRAPAADTTGQWVLDERGVGPVRVGMAVAQADRAVPGGLSRTSGLEPQCDMVHPKRGQTRLYFMIADGRVVRVDAHDGAQVATPAGARIGDSEARVRSLYPAARVQPHKYVDGHYIIVIPGAPADTLHRIVFETNGSVVTSMRGGTWPHVEYVETCS